MGGLLLIVFGIAMLCVAIGNVPSLASIKILLIFIIGAIIVFGGAKLWDDLDDKF